MSASPAAIPGVVFEGTVDGWFRAYNSSNGRLLWEHSTSQQTYSTVNGRPDQPGGSIDGNGPTIANGMVFVTSGYNGAIGQGGNGTNVLLAYSVDGK
jgi:polyvinyl alcohol dehydrogenase (cytochrome)